MAVNYMRFVIRCLVGVAIAVGIAIGFLVLAPRYREWRLMIDRREHLNQEIAFKQQELTQIKRNQLRFREDPEFVEHVARKNRRVRPGEIVFIFDPPPEDAKEEKE